MKFRCQFVAALKDAELSCTTISGTTIGTMSLSQMKYSSAFVAALEEAELLCTGA
jgi:hypothetical protein